MKLVMIVALCGVIGFLLTGCSASDRQAMRDEWEEVKEAESSSVEVKKVAGDINYGIRRFIDDEVTCYVYKGFDGRGGISCVK